MTYDPEVPFLARPENSELALDSDGLVQKLEDEAKHMNEILSDGLSDLSVIRPSVDLKRPPANLAFKDVSFSFKDKVLLEKCSGCFEPGEVVAIMGPSGCGKTTLLDILAGKKTGQIDGEVLMNGRQRDYMFQRVTAYVDQEDHMPEFWTVREAIEFNLALKYRTLSLKGMPPKLKSTYCDVMLKAFGLHNHADVYIGGSSVRGCSGGQKRRVTLARGIAQRVSIVFADEPTSGLSATDAVLCVRSLRVVAKRFGVLMLIVIHQPRLEVIKLFDRLLMLTSNPGRVVYNNKLEEAERYFGQFQKYTLPEQTNPTDFYLDLATPGSPKDQVEALVSAFKSQEAPKVEEKVQEMLKIEGDSPENMLKKSKSGLSKIGYSHEVRMHSQSVYAEGFGVQLQHLLLRKVRLTRRNPMSIAVSVGLPISMAVVMGIMFYNIGEKQFDKQMPFIFMQTTNLGVAGMQLISTLIQERSIMKNESAKGLYSEFAWALSQFLVDVPLCLLGGMLNILILYYLGGLEWANWPIMLKWCLLLFFVFNALFSLLAAVAKDSRTACAFANCFNMIFASCSGFMLNKKDCPVYLRWLFKISPNAYAMQSIVVGLAPDCMNITAHCDIVNKTEQCQSLQQYKMLPSDSGEDCYRWVDMLNAQYGFETNAEEFGLLLMVSIIVTFKIGEVLALKYMNKVSK